MADNNSKKPMALLLLVVVAVLVVILMTPPVNCTTGTCEDTTLLTQEDCVNGGKKWSSETIHVHGAKECTDKGGVYWDLTKKDGCEAAGKTWTDGNPGDSTAVPPVEATSGECK